MTGLSPETPRKRDDISGAFLSLLPTSLHELRRDTEHLLESNWADPVRRRAHELASTLAEACGRQGMEEIAGIARSIACLTRLSREEATSLRAAIREKFAELLDLAQRLVSEVTKRHTA